MSKVCKFVIGFCKFMLCANYSEVNFNKISPPTIIPELWQPA
jgi:hypothetical protein